MLLLLCVLSVCCVVLRLSLKPFEQLCDFHTLYDIVIHVNFSL